MCSIHNLLEAGSSARQRGGNISTASVHAQLWTILSFAHATVRSFKFPECVRSRNIVAYTSIITASDVTRKGVFPPESSAVSGPRLGRICLGARVPPVEEGEAVVTPAASHL